MFGVMGGGRLGDWLFGVGWGWGMGLCILLLLVLVLAWRSVVIHRDVLVVVCYAIYIPFPAKFMVVSWPCISMASHVLAMLNACVCFLLHACSISHLIPRVEYGRYEGTSPHPAIQITYIPSITTIHTPT